MYKRSKNDILKQSSLFPYIPDSASSKPNHFRIKKRQSSDETGLVVSEHQMDVLPNSIGDEDHVPNCDGNALTDGNKDAQANGRLHQQTSTDSSTPRKRKRNIVSAVIQLTKEKPSTEEHPAADSERKTAQNNSLKTYSVDKQQTLSIPGVPMEHRGSISQLSISSNSLIAPSIYSFSSSGNGPNSLVSRNDSRISFIVRERLHSLALDLNRRTSEVKQHIQRPPTPDSDLEGSTTGVNAEKEEGGGGGDKRSLNSLVTDYAPSPVSFQALDVSQLNDVPLWKKQMYQKCYNVRLVPNSLDPQGKKYLAWLVFVSICFLYNIIAIPLRAAYPYQNSENLCYWLIADYFCDTIYLLDMILMKPRLRFMKGGLPVKTKKDLLKRYLHSSMFKFDLLSLLPLDILYLKVGPNSLLRLPRILKFHSYMDLFYLLDSLVKNPYLLRISKSLIYLIYVIHVNSCIYYSISAWEGLNSTPWTYNGQGNAYLRCFYFSTKVATSIGNTEDPTNVVENLYMLISWMMGVFIVAMLLGQIRDIVATASKNREEFRKTMDAALQYCQALKLPPEVQNKVREWFIYTWREQKTLNENDFLQSLPRKLQTDLAISVHFQTLNKVQLFQEVDKALLRDLVLKLEPVLFLPGDYVCKKGEVGKEMYIVSKGVLEVIGGPNGTTVFATLKEGSVFGEVSLLAVGGGNRRTADVKSKGFSNLFVLSKDDLNETIKDYPDAQKILKRKARQLIKKHEGEEKCTKTNVEKAATLSSRVKTPKLLETVAQVVSPSSKSGLMLKAMMEKDALKRHSRRRHGDSSTDANVIDENGDDACDDADSDLDSDTSSILDDVLSGMSVQDILRGRLPDNADIEIINEPIEDENNKSRNNT